MFHVVWELLIWMAVDLIFLSVQGLDINAVYELYLHCYSSSWRSCILQISLEFHQKKRARWPFPAECIPWEVWTIKLDVITLANEHGNLIFFIISYMYVYETIETIANLYWHSYNMYFCVAIENISKIHGIIDYVSIIIFYLWL